MGEQSVKDRIRSKLLGQDRIKSKVIEIDGERILVRQPTGKTYEAMDKDSSAFRQHAIVLTSCTFYCDEAGAPIGPLFTSADVDRILEMSPGDPVLKALSDALTSLTDTKALEAEATKSP